MRMRHLSTCIAVTGFLLFGGLATTPASASASAGYVDGAGDETDDLYDEGVLSTTQHARSNATCLWQKLLWANGEFNWSDIDGVFGAKTEAATRSFQRHSQINDDGIVGNLTFKAAEDGEKGMDIVNESGYYVGPLVTFKVFRDSSHRYHFYDRTGAERIAGYNYLTCA
ncbi:peptidoglycan-binding protein [Streptomyces sp. NPDC048508]|uniref:peptidoglycan-binding domain-containing protein n=1 Tax=Streptomyces sp. NPDC048508 TaxID=3365561 RepID=UPI00371AB1DC